MAYRHTVCVTTEGKSLASKKMRSAPRGSKKGWVPVTAKIPPQMAERLEHLETVRGTLRTDLVQEAIALLLTSYGYPVAA